MLVQYQNNEEEESSAYMSTKSKDNMHQDQDIAAGYEMMFANKNPGKNRNVTLYIKDSSNTEEFSRD